MKDAHAALQKTITWIKKSRKGRQEWVKAWENVQLKVLASLLVK